MAYKAKNPRKKQLRIRIEKCWYVTVENETETELDNDLVFGTRADAEKCGQKMLKIMERCIADAGKASVAFGGNHIACGGTSIVFGGDMVDGKPLTALDELQKEMDKKCSPES